MKNKLMPKIKNILNKIVGKIFPKQISKNSQVWKFNARWGDMLSYEQGYKQLTRCGYFWMTVWKIIVGIIWGASVAHIIWNTGMEVFDWCFGFNPWMFGFIIGQTVAMLTGVLVIAVAALFCIGLIDGFKRLVKIKPLKRIKNKLCPVLEIVE